MRRRSAAAYALHPSFPPCAALPRYNVPGQIHIINIVYAGIRARRGVARGDSCRAKRSTAGGCPGPAC